MIWRRGARNEEYRDPSFSIQTRVVNGKTGLRSWARDFPTCELQVC